MSSSRLSDGSVKEFDRYGRKGTSGAIGPRRKFAGCVSERSRVRKGSLGRWLGDEVCRRWSLKGV